MSHTLRHTTERGAFALVGNPDLSGEILFIKNGIVSTVIPGELLRQWFAKYGNQINIDMGDEPAEER